MALSSWHTWAAALVAALAAFIVRLYQRSASFTVRAHGRPLPPGPRGLPLIGNFFTVSSETPWKVYSRLGALYGKVVYLSALGQPILVVNDYDVAVELMERRSAIYSDRPLLRMVTLTGWEWVIGFMPYGEVWRKHRRMLWQQIYPRAVAKYEFLQKDTVRRLLLRVLLKPQEMNAHVRYELVAFFIRAMYGLDVAADDDKYITVFEKATPSMHLIVTGSICEYFPLLARLPKWFRRLVAIEDFEEIRSNAAELRNLPFNDARNNVMAGVGSREGAITSIFNRIPHGDGEVEGELGDVEVNVLEVARNSLGVAFLGVDTTVSLVTSFFVAMSLYPEVQKRACAELDAVVGGARLPGLHDRSMLPYVNAVVKEALRWHVVTPLGVSHATTGDDEFDGYFIPRGTTVLPNQWAMLHDPLVYPRPEEFIPERFLRDGKLNPQVRDPEKIAFGFGRRNCPGRHLANTTAFIVIASILHTFAITPSGDEAEQPTCGNLKVSNGLVSYIENYEYTVKPRSKVAEALIRKFA